MIQRIGRGCALAALVLLLVSAQTPQPQPVDGTPLLRAKLALEMARARVLEDRFADAAASLRDASKALADYAKDSPGPHAETALFIRGELDSYAAQIVRNHADALDRIDLWRQPVEQWYGAIRPSARQQ
jgi:hypothetical protein